MTIIAAMDCGTHLLMAADSQVTEGNGIKLRFTRDKLDSLSDPPLAWWYAGDEGVGAEFVKWVKSGLKPERLSTWLLFRDAALLEFARLNRAKREMVVRAAGREPYDHELAHALIAGYIAGEREILEMDHKGGHSFDLSYRFAAIGAGRPLAWTALKTLEEVQGADFRHDEATFRLIMGVVARLADICSPPVRMLRLTAEGVEELASSP